jgi:hypothetical protein
MAIRSAVDGGIMEDHNLAIGGELDIQLDSIGALLQGQLESRHCIFRCLFRGAPVCQQDRFGKILKHEKGTQFYVVGMDAPRGGDIYDCWPCYSSTK